MSTYEVSRQAPKKRKHGDSGVSIDSQAGSKKKKRKNKEQTLEHDLPVPPPVHNTEIDPQLLTNPNDDSQASTMSILSAIVAAATNDPASQYAYYPDMQTQSAGLYSDQANVQHHNDPVLQALQDIDITKIASVLKTLGDAAVAADVPFTNPAHLLPPVAPLPQPLSQVPVSSEAILNKSDESPAPNNPNPGQYTRTDHADLLATKWLTSTKLAALVASEGLVYKKGKFSSVEEQQVRAAIENYRVTKQLTAEQLEAVIFPKGQGERDNAFWTEITFAVPQRPVVAVYHYVRRAYHPLKQQGKWLPAEDDRLRQAVANHGQQWEKVSEEVGRRAADCRDRYRNHIVNRDIRVSGAWSAEEEAELTKIVTELTISQGKDMDNDVFWGLVSAKMGGKRGRQQCRIKWTDSLSKLVKNDGKKPRWNARDAYILVQKIDSLDIHDDTEIDWKILPDPNWNLFSAHILQRRWLTMKRSIKGHEEMSHQEIMDILKAKKTNISVTPSTSSSSSGQKSKAVTSADGITDSDSDGQL